MSEISATDSAKKLATECSRKAGVLWSLLYVLTSVPSKKILHWANVCYVAH